MFLNKKTRQYLLMSLFFWSGNPLSAQSFSFSKEKEKGYRLYRG
ncbi:MAG: hypothetical protein N4A45_08770 [Flavobacteriales bacterium]|jgi:hypothetical protein|nr:hypothetical protein [Flavobacteriales bacterium]